MILFIDKLIVNDLGGITNDLRKAEYILAVHGWTFDEMLKNSSPTAKIPSGMFGTGRFIVAFNIAWDLSNVNFGFINCNIDLVKNFDTFADCMSPKSVAGFHKLQEELKLKKQSESTKIELSDNDSDFEIAYRNYIEHRNRQ